MPEPDVVLETPDIRIQFGLLPAREPKKFTPTQPYGMATLYSVQ